MESRNLEYVTTREPTERVSGVYIKKLLKEKAKESDNYHRELALLFAADRIDHNENVIIPALKSEKVVLCDRYVFSSLAYQTVKLPFEWVREINKYARLLDVLFYIDISVETALKRIADRKEIKEVFETENYLKSIRENYLNLLEEYKNRCKVIVFNGEVPIEKIYSEIEVSFESLF